MKIKQWSLALFATGTVVAWTAPLLLADGPAWRVLLIAFGSALAYLALAEVLFRILYWLRTGTQPERFIRIPFEHLHAEPHPYMPYAYKRNFTPGTDMRRDMTANYPLHKGRFSFCSPAFNNFRLQNGPERNHHVTVPKPEGLFRVLCLGGSTTGNYIEENGIPYSYPMELEKALRERHPDRDIEVVNGGMGGRTSADLLIHFLLSLVDTDPDAVVLYHGHNDLGPSLTPGFNADYSHARRNLGEAYNTYRVRAMFPDLPFALYNYLLNSLFPGNLTNSLLQNVTLSTPDLDGEFKGTGTYKRNLRHVIDVCKTRGIRVVCSTFCHHTYDEIRKCPRHNKFLEGLALENQAMRELAEESGALFIDAAGSMPDDDAYFVDSIHFTPGE